MKDTVKIMKRFVRSILSIIIAVTLCLGMTACNMGSGGLNSPDPVEGLVPDIEGVSPDRISEDSVKDTPTPDVTTVVVPTDILPNTNTPDNTPTPTPTPPKSPDTPEVPFLDYKQHTPGEKLIAFTFNDGPTAYSEKIPSRRSLSIPLSGAR